MSLRITSKAQCYMESESRANHRQQENDTQHEDVNLLVQSVGKELALQEGVMEEQLRFL